VVLFPPLALYHFGLAVLYAIYAALALPCLYKRGGVFLLALAPLAAAYPVLACLRSQALLLPCLPALAGLLYGRWMGWYAAAALAAVTLVAGLVTGQAAMGVVHIGGDEQPLMESEIMTVARDSLFPPDTDDWLESSGETAGGRPGGFVAALLMWLLGGWELVWLLGAYGVVAEGLLPRFTPPLLAQVILWAAVGGATAWAAWPLAKAPAKRLIWVAVVVLCGVALTVVGHAALSRAFGMPSMSFPRALPAAITQITDTVPSQPTAMLWPLAASDPGIVSTVSPPLSRRQ
jgi:hypothetical protein